MEEGFVFASERLRYRMLREADAQAVFAHHAEKTLLAGIPNEQYDTLSETLETLRFLIARAQKGEMPYILAVTREDSDEYIGSAGICSIPEGVEIDYAIAERYQHNGYGTEAVRAMTSFAKTRFSLPCLYGKVMRDNEASKRTLIRAGYAFICEESRPKGDPYEKGMMVYRYDYAK